MRGGGGADGASPGALAGEPGGLRVRRERDARTRRQHGAGWPQGARRGRNALRRLTFSYDFVNKDVQQNHPLKDQFDKATEIKDEIKKRMHPSEKTTQKIQQVEQTLEIFMEDEEDNEDNP